jgi:hypothetical protein
MKKCLIDDPLTAWDDILKWGIKELKSRKLKAVLCNLSWDATVPVYHLWSQRNDLKFGNQLKRGEKMVKIISSEITARIMARGKFNRTQENLVLCRSWGIPENVLCRRIL